MMSATLTSPKSAFSKISLSSKQKPLRIMVLGQSGVGKSALVVRFITRRYIGEYDPKLEKIYSFHTLMDSEVVYFEILDTAGQPNECEFLSLESNIRWAEAFILMYSVTDKCSFDECNRLKFLINYNKRRKWLGSASSKDSTVIDVPVVLVGNKNDQWGDRMVTLEDGLRRSKEIGCVCFHEISVRESIDQVWAVFRDTFRFWKVHSKFPKLKRSSSDTRSDSIVSPDSSRSHSVECTNSNLLGGQWSDTDSHRILKEEVETSQSEPFRGRAQTDGLIFQRPRRWHYPPPVMSTHVGAQSTPRTDRRMSISMRGNNASY